GLLVGLADDRHDVLAHEVARGVAHHALLLGEELVEVEVVEAAVGHARRPAFRGGAESSNQPPGGARRPARLSLAASSGETAMITLRPAAERGHFDHGWLDTHHSFSFADYHDPQHMGFRSLRVINEDRVQPGEEFGTHGHRDMEILSWVLEGQLAHKDNMGHGSIIRPGEAQRMSAGTGVMHSERNPSRSEPVHFLQIWLLPERRGLTPGYEQKNFADARGLTLLASRDGREGSVTMHQDADIWL